VRILFVFASLAIAGCGAREPLRPASGQELPRAPALSTRALTPEQLLAVPSEFRPVRVDEPLTRSQRREPALSTRALTPEQLLAVPSEFRPVRVDEPLTRSQRREPDRFALPPPDEEGAQPEAEEGQETQEAGPATVPPVSPQ